MNWVLLKESRQINEIDLEMFLPIREQACTFRILSLASVILQRSSWDPLELDVQTPTNT